MNDGRRRDSDCQGCSAVSAASPASSRSAPRCGGTTRSCSPARALGTTDLAGAHLYLAIGEHEARLREGWPHHPDEVWDAVPAYDTIDMVADVSSVATLLRTNSAARVDTEVIADESHNTIWAAGVTRGLIALYGLEQARRPA